MTNRAKLNFEQIKSNQMPTNTIIKITTQPNAFHTIAKEYNKKHTITPAKLTFTEYLSSKKRQDKNLSFEFPCHHVKTP